MTTPVCSQTIDSNQVIIVHRSSERRGRKRAIGTFLERLEVLKAAEEVLVRMEESGFFDDVDLKSFRSTIVGFLREPATNLLGLCSYSRTHRTAKSPGERTWRILLNRNLLYTERHELHATIYHEFLHGILGYDEGHGERFNRFESLWPL
jgi:hypothetical protein